MSQCANPEIMQIDDRDTSLVIIPLGPTSLVILPLGPSS